MLLETLISLFDNNYRIQKKYPIIIIIFPASRKQNANMRHYLKMKSLLKALVSSIMMFDLILLTKGELNNYMYNFKRLVIYMLTFIINL